MYSEEVTTSHNINNGGDYDNTNVNNPNKTTADDCISGGSDDDGNDENINVNNPTKATEDDCISGESEESETEEGDGSEPKKKKNKKKGVGAMLWKELSRTFLGQVAKLLITYFVFIIIIIYHIQC